LGLGVPRGLFRRDSEADEYTSAAVPGLHSPSRGPFVGVVDMNHPGAMEIGTVRIFEVDLIKEARFT
jgi:hypothetical protein